MRSALRYQALSPTASSTAGATVKSIDRPGAASQHETGRETAQFQSRVVSPLMIWRTVPVVWRLAFCALPVALFRGLLLRCQSRHIDAWLLAA